MTSEVDELRELVLSLQRLLFKTIEKMTQLERKLTYVGVTGGASNFTDLAGTIANAQTPNTLLLDGSRAMTGLLNANYGVKVVGEVPFKMGSTATLPAPNANWWSSLMMKSGFNGADVPYLCLLTQEVPPVYDWKEISLV